MIPIKPRVVSKVPLFLNLLMLYRLGSLPLYVDLSTGLVSFGRRAKTPTTTVHFLSANFHTCRQFPFSVPSLLFEKTHGFHTYAISADWKRATFLGKSSDL